MTDLFNERRDLSVLRVLGRIRGSGDGTVISDDLKDPIALVDCRCHEFSVPDWGGLTAETS